MTIFLLLKFSNKHSNYSWSNTPFCVCLINYYSWITYSATKTSWVHLDSVINWTDATSILNSDIFVYFIFILQQYSSIYFSTYSPSLTTFSDILFSNSLKGNPGFLVTAFYMDIYTLVQSLFSSSFFLFNFEGYNLIAALLYSNPELLLLYSNYLNQFHDLVSPNVTQTYNVFSFNQASSTNIIVQSFFSLIFFVIYVFVLFFLLSTSSLSSSFHFNWLKFYSFIVNFSGENRLQLDFSFVFLSFIFVCWLPLLIGYDDINVELVELFHNGICLLFVFIIVFFLVKYSIHYFSFLENSVMEGLSASFIAKQFVRDVSNSFALFLRFFLLLFRLNIYDGLDDFLDSYYIFFIDFDEDSYFDEMFWTENAFMFNQDNHEDNIFYMPSELDFSLDLFSRYFVLLGKFLFFWFFILEEIFRVSLAFYISYLIIFEVHAVNVSYSEDNFIQSKKNNN